MPPNNPTTNTKDEKPTFRTTPIAKAISAILIGVFLAFGLAVSLFLHTALEKDFGEIQQNDFDRRMNTYGALINQFIQLHTHLVEDISTHPIFSQSVMQPDSMRAGLADYMNRLQLMGEKVQMSLLDFEGGVIHSTKTTPSFDY